MAEASVVSETSVSSQTSSTRTEGLTTPEAKIDKGAIGAFNTIFLTYRRKAQQLESQPPENLSSEKRGFLGAFHIVNNGLGELTGKPGEPIPDTQTTDLFKAKLKDPENPDEEIKGELGIRVDPLIKLIDEDIDDLTQKRQGTMDAQATNLSASRASVGLDDTIRMLQENREVLIQNSRPHTEIYPPGQNPSRDMAMQRLEAEIISKDPARRQVDDIANFVQAGKELAGALYLKFAQRENPQTATPSINEYGEIVEPPITPEEPTLPEQGKALPIPESKKTLEIDFHKRIADALKNTNYGKSLRPYLLTGLVGLGLVLAAIPRDSVNASSQPNQPAETFNPKESEQPFGPSKPEENHPRWALKTQIYDQLGHSLKGLFEKELALKINPALAQKADAQGGNIDKTDKDLIETVNKFEQDYPDHFNEGLNLYRQIVEQSNPFPVIEPNDFDRDRLIATNFKTAEIDNQFQIQVDQMVAQKKAQGTGATN